MRKIEMTKSEIKEAILDTNKDLMMSVINNERDKIKLYQIYLNSLVGEYLKDE